MAGALEKLKIVAFAKDDFTGPPVGAFVAFFNPKSYKLTNSHTYDESEEAGKSLPRQIYKKTASRSLTFNFMLDGTGVTGPQSISSELSSVPTELWVQTQLRLFQTLTGFNGLTHQPAFLIINWGTLVFTGVMESYDVDYQLFNSAGIPLRALITANFKEHTTDSLAGKLARLSSPDLTHTRIVKAGDTLPLMCKEIYDDESYYLEVAKANKLLNFRRLKEGDEIVFPPIVNSD